MTNPALEAFGRLLMTYVRDKAIEESDKLIDGRMKGETAQKAAKLLSDCTEHERTIIKAIVPEIVDTALHHLLWTIERTESVSLSLDGGPELRELSDGLTGDFHIWKERYSRQRSF